MSHPFITMTNLVDCRPVSITTTGVPSHLWDHYYLKIRETLEATAALLAPGTPAKEALRPVVRSDPILDNAPSIWCVM